MTISIDDELKRDFSEVCHEIGLSPSTAFSLFARVFVRERAIPFTLSAESTRERATRAYELSVADGIARGFADMEAGKVISREDSRAMRAAAKRVTA